LEWSFLVYYSNPYNVEAIKAVRETFRVVAVVVIMLPTPFEGCWLWARRNSHGDSTVCPPRPGPEVKDEK